MYSVQHCHEDRIRVESVVSVLAQYRVRDPDDAIRGGCMDTVYVHVRDHTIAHRQSRALREVEAPRVENAGAALARADAAGQEAGDRPD